jgi:hypothetical protein
LPASSYQLSAVNKTAIGDRLQEECRQGDRWLSQAIRLVLEQALPDLTEEEHHEKPGGELRWDIQWMFLAVGMVAALVGGILTASIVGAIVGIPLLLVPWPLLKNPAVPATCT